MGFCTFKTRSLTYKEKKDHIKKLKIYIKINLLGRKTYILMIGFI